MISVAFFIVLVIVLCISIVVNVFLIKSYLRTDSLIELLIDDINTNLRYFEKLKKSNLLSRSEEVLTMHKNMIIMAARFEEFKQRLREETGRIEKTDEEGIEK